MTGSAQTKARLSRLGGRGLANLIKLVQRTSTRVCDPPDFDVRLYLDNPVIVACWHGQFMMLCGLKTLDEYEVAAMVARHGDAELIGEAMRQFDVELIRGAGAGERKKDRGGAYALRASLKALKAGKSLVMTADVPPGPARKAGAGIIMLAKMSGCPIYPVASATTRFHSFNTWSRLTLNLPYSKLAYASGTPVEVPRDADEAEIEACRQRLEAELNKATVKAYEMVGADVLRATPAGALPPGAPPPKPGLQLQIYRNATRLIQPAAGLILGRRESQGKEDPARRGERMGRASLPRPDGALAWFHAASVGETNAILPLIDALRASRADVKVLLTTGTRTSAAIADERLGEGCIHQYVPLDTPGFAKRFLDHWRPNLAVFTESEIWPNLILETSKRAIPLAIVNGRMSSRSYDRWRKKPAIANPLFARFDTVLAQNRSFARKFSELGARNVEAPGNLKIDAPAPQINSAALNEMRAALGSRPFYVAASTHEGEETIIAAAHRSLATSFPSFCTIIAPRHPERGTGLAEDLKAKGFRIAQRSNGQMPGERTDIYIADTLGELGTLFDLSPIAFIGGSLIGKGGQNPIEAIRHSAAILTGPSQHNFKDSYEVLLADKAVLEIADAEQLAAGIAGLLTNDTERQHMLKRAQTSLTKLAGALDSTLAALIALLPPADRQQEQGQGQGGERVEGQCAGSTSQALAEGEPDVIPGGASGDIRRAS